MLCLYNTYGLLDGQLLRVSVTLEKDEKVLNIVANFANKVLTYCYGVCTYGIWFHEGHDHVSDILQTAVISSHLKGQSHKMDIFWRSIHFNQYFLCMRWWFSRSFKSFSLPYTNINFLFASLKLLTNFENTVLTETLHRIPFSVIVKVLWCRPLIGCRKNAHGSTGLVTGGFRYDFTESQVASYRHFQLSKSPLKGLWSGLREGFSKLVSNVKGAC